MDYKPNVYHNGDKNLNILPNLKQCPTLYTNCDYVFEQCAHEIILKLEDQFKAHSNLIEEELKIQNDYINDMWIKSQQFLILTRNAIYIKPYPEIISVTKENQVLCSFNQSLQKINESNYHIEQSLEDICKTMTILKGRCDLLDTTIDSPFIGGAYYIKPLLYIRNVLKDLFSYFHQHLCKLKCWAALLDSCDCAAVEDYMALIKPNWNYEKNLNEYLDHCRCLRSYRKVFLQSV